MSRLGSADGFWSSYLESLKQLQMEVRVGVIWKSKVTQHPGKLPQYGWQSMLVLSSEFRLSAGMPPHDFTMWLGLPRASQLGSERECPKSESLKRSKWELQGFLRFISKIPEYHFCVLLIKQIIKPGPDSSGGELGFLMWGTGCMKLAATIFGDVTIVCLIAATIHIPSICKKEFSSQDPHSLISLRHQFEVQDILSKSGPDIGEASSTASREQFLLSWIPFRDHISPYGFELLSSVLSFYLIGLHWASLLGQL